MLHEEATACVAVPLSHWLLCTYDPRDRLEKPAFLFLFVSCAPSHLNSKVGGQEGAEGLTPKSIPLGHKSVYFTERKIATHMLLLSISLVFYKIGLIVKQYNS